MDSSRRYSGIATANHWITALLVIAMLALGLAAGYAPDDMIETYILDVHIALGFFVLLFVLWRVGFRLYEGFPPPGGATSLEQRGAGLVHRLLLLALTLQVLTGPLYLFTEGEAMDVFGLFTFYLPLEWLAVIHEPVEEVHVITGVYLLPILLGIHILAGIRHYLATEPRSRARRPAQ